MNDVRIPVWMGLHIFMRENHDVWSSEWIYGVLLSSQVVSHIVYLKQTVVIHEVVLDVDTSPIILREVVLIAVVHQTTCTS